MAGSWSNPYQDPHTAAAVAPDALHFADIGAIVGHIMQMRENQAKAKDEATRQMIAGAGQAVVGAKEGYDKYQTNQDQGALSNYMQRSLYDQTYTSDQQQADLMKMSPEARTKAMLWSQQQAPQTAMSGGTQFVRGSGGGWSPVKSTGQGVGLGGTNEEYFMENGVLYKKNLKTGATSTVPNKTTEDFKRTDQEINKMAGDTGVDVNKLKSIDLTRETVGYWKTDSEGKPIQQISTAEANRISADKKQPMPVAILPDGTTIPYKSFKPEVIHQYQTAAEAAKTVPAQFQSRSANAFGGGHITSEADRIKAAYQSGQLSREEAVQQLRALGMQ